MPIELITGLPGNAKTLYTIGEVKKRAEEEGRPVYYAGIKELTLDWTPIEPTKWMDAPAGSIIVIDECQKIFRNRSMGAVAPLHVTELEEHRHKGLDFYLITQHPSLVDPAIRRLTQTHRHMIRIFGMEASTVHKWNGCTPNPDVNAARASSEKVRWAFDKSLYGVYKSAEVHTVKRSIPMRLKLLLLIPLALGAAAWTVKHFTIDKAQERAEKLGVQTSSAPGVPSTQVGMQRHDGPEPFDPMKDAQHYVQMNTPRVEGLAHTAPKYDQITQPVRAPVPAACIQVGTPSSEKGVTCKCMTQDATPMAVPFNMCIEFARNGWFQDFNPEKEKEQLARSVEGARVLEGRNGVLEGSRESASHVVAFSNPPREAPYVPQVTGRNSGG